MVFFDLRNFSNYNSKINYYQFFNVNINDQIVQLKEIECKGVAA